MKRAEEKRLKDEERRKTKMPKSSTPEDGERPMTASEAPVLDPIPSVEPMNPEDELKRPQLRTTLTEEIMLQAEEAKRASNLVEGPNRSSTLAEEPGVLPSSGYTEADNAGAATPVSFDATQIAERVLSAPVTDPSEEITVPIPKPDGPASNTAQPTIISPPLASESAATEPKPAGPIHQPIGLPAATTETTVTGPTPTQRQPRGEGKVSSWIKNKLRRSSKPGKPAISKPVPIEDASNEKAFVGGANLAAATSTTKSGTDPGSVSEVAMVGKPSLNVPNATSTTTSTSAEIAPVVPTESEDDDLYAASTQGKGKEKRRSRSSSPVSSLSSDEGEHPRGRSQLRREVTDSDENGGEQEFEEAKDHFETEVLAPPAPLKNTVGRASDSPVRDSIFKEDL